MSWSSRNDPRHPPKDVLKPIGPGDFILSLFHKRLDWRGGAILPRSRLDFLLTSTHLPKNSFLFIFLVGWLVHDFKYRETNLVS